MFWPINQSNLKPLKHTAALNPESLPETTPKDFEFDYIDIGSVTYGKGIIEKQKMIFADAPSRARKPVKENDLIISTVRTYLRAIAMISEADSGNIASTGFVVCRPKEGTLPAFLYYAVHSQPFIEQVVALSTGMSYPAINPSTLGDIKLPFPKPEQQTAIARFLDRETARIDGLIEKKGRFIELLKEKRAAVITHAVTKGFEKNVEMKSSGEAWIGDIPAHWEVKPLRTFFKYRNEKNDPVKTENILSLSIAHGVTPYSEEGRGGNKSKDDLTAYKIAHEGDIVLNSMNVIVGAVGRSKYHGAISPVYYALYPVDDGVYVPFFEKIFMNTGFQKGLLRFGKGILMKISGTGQMNTIRMKISQDDLKTVAFPVPPHEEQVEIARHIEFEVSRIDGLIAKTDRSIELLKEKRSALITAAVTGKVDVRNAA